MEKNSILQTNTVTSTTTITTTTTATSAAEQIPVVYVPINNITDIGAEDYYKAKGIPVRTMPKFGKNRTYAIAPMEGYETASADEKTKLAEKADTISQAIDNMRRKAARKTGRVAEHEKVSLDGLFDAGYDPTLDTIEVAITISHKIADSEFEPSTTENTEIEDTCTANALDDECSDSEYTGKKSVSRGRYESFNDLNNPEYIVAKATLYSKLHAIINELDGEDLEIVMAIMEGESERKLAERLDVNLSTLQRHRVKLMARLRDILGEENNF